MVAFTRWSVGGQVRARPGKPRDRRVTAGVLRDGVDSIVMEVSSHAIDQRRTDGIRFAAMALTNVTRDHLDYHPSMEAYAETKMSIFERMKEENPDAIGVVNLDDSTGAELARRIDPEHRIAYGVESAEAIGSSTRRIMFLHILPNAISPIVVTVSMGMGVLIGTEIILSFLGLGIQPPRPSLGNMLLEAGSLSALREVPWMLLAPGMVAWTLVLSWNLLGDALNDVLNPRTR